MPVDTTALRALIAKASPLPWHRNGLEPFNPDENGTLMIAAVNALPGLLDHIAEIEQRLSDVQDDLTRQLGEMKDENIRLESGLHAAWQSMTDAERLAFDCCRHCGSLDPRCQCWNDE